MIKLLPDWRDILKTAWSVKFLVAAGLVSFAETVMQIAGTALLPTGFAPAIVGILSSLGILARVLAQKEAEQIAEDDK